MEFDMKDQMIRQTIITTQEDVKEIKESIENKYINKIPIFAPIFNNKYNLI